MTDNKQLMTTNDTQVFSFGNNGELRVFMRDNEPWFVGKDVAEMLGYNNTQKAIRDHVDDDDKLTE